MIGKYKVITLCGSTRFKNEFFDKVKAADNPAQMLGVLE